MHYLVLIKNPDKYNKDPYLIYFYKYTENWDPLNKGTSHFIDKSSDPGGFSSEELINYQDKDGIAVFMIDKCTNDNIKRVGELRFYNSQKYNFYKPDTLIYHCK